MIFRPYYYYDTGCAAYVFGCGTIGECAVVDPQERDVASYVDFAAQKSMKITHVIDTHVHADHRSGGRELAKRTGARYCLSRAASVEFPFEPLDDGQTLTLGNTIIQAVHTPGHTPESMCLLVRDLRRGDGPWFLLTGDTLFVGAVGRPDLPGKEAENARTLHESIQKKILSLPDDIEIYPGHFLGSACGAGMSGKPMSTLGFEKRWNASLKLAPEAFVANLLKTTPAKPADVEEILRFNRGMG